MKRLNRSATAFLCTLLLMGSACTSESGRQANIPEVSENVTMITLELGKNTQDLKSRITSVPVKSNETAGLMFTKMSWVPPNLGHLSIEHDGQAIDIRNVFSATALEDSEQPDDGILSYTVLCGLTSEEQISHNEALKEMNAILDRVLAAGWLPYTPRSRPRLKGQDRIEYVLNESSMLGLDATVPLTLDQWLRLEDSTDWKFYGASAYLTVSFRRQPQPVMPNEAGIYLVSIEIMTSKSFDQGHVKSEDRGNWEKVLPTVLPTLAEIRAKRESELKARGIIIDTNYKDPPVSISH